jgi:predicted CXXCH cytochrome family protein
VDFLKQKLFLLNSLIIMIFVINLQTRCEDHCYRCHSGLSDKPSSLYRHDIHFTKKILCADCHGGDAKTDDMEKAMNRNSGFIGVPKGDEISKTCAKCHSNPGRMKELSSERPTGQWEKLQTSVHAKPSLSGKEKIVQCPTCHSVHNIVSVTNASSPVFPLNIIKTCAGCHADAIFMGKYNPSLPVDQLEKYGTSIHGIRNAKGDIKTAECASCHGSHDIYPANDVRSLINARNIPATCSHCHSNSAYMKEYNIPTDQFDKFAGSVHGIALLKKNDVAAPACNDCHGNHGAIPPGITSISKVCGTCHALNAELFSSSPHKKAFDDLQLPECETCHGNHEIIAATDKLLGVNEQTVCSRCHSETQNDKGFVVARTMRHLIDSLEMSKNYAASLVTEAEQKGMEISDAKFKLRDINQLRMQARTMVHSFNEEKYQTIIEKGLEISGIVSKEGKDAIDEYYFHRWGLGIATLIITIVIASLYLTIRKIEQKQKNKTTSIS